MTFSTRTLSTRTRVAVGAFVVAAAAAPAFLAGVTAHDADVTAAPACLAWFGNKEDGKCLSYSNGMPANIGTPWVGAGGKRGFVTGPLLPGTSINQGIG